MLEALPLEGQGDGGEQLSKFVEGYLTTVPDVAIVVYSHTHDYGDFLLPLPL